MRSCIAIFISIAVMVSLKAEEQSPLSGFALIPGGTFQMGDHHDLGGREHRNDEAPVHKVRIDAFQMGITEVTNRQYSSYLNQALSRQLIELREGAVYGRGGKFLYCDTRQSAPYSGIGWDGTTFRVLDGREDHPMVGVRWHGAAAYCNWLSEENGHERCYDPSTWDRDLSETCFRLPTEAEWEYAARGGHYGPYYIFPWGDEPDNAKANWPRSGDPYETGAYPWTTPAGFHNGKLHRRSEFNWPGSQQSYQTANGANGYGLYDTAGNVWEWTNDWYNRDYYANSPDENPPGPARGSPMPDGRPYRVLRGGSWYNGEYGHSRVSNRDPAYFRGPRDPSHPWYHVGFRVALASPTAPASPSAPARTVGLFRNEPEAFRGYTLFAPKHNTTTYLMDNDGRVVHTWKSEYEPGQSVYLLPNGHLLHACFTKNQSFIRGGEGGRIEEYDWDGNLVWEFWHSTDRYLSHHDIEPLPNGNILALAVEKKSYKDCITAGFNPDMMQDRQLFPDYVIEIRKTGPASGKIVWEWHVWDHLIQDHDPKKENYGDVAAHPELIDANGSGRRIRSFWNHMNSIAYNPKLDQIVLSVRGNNEIWVIDHSTSSTEAAGRAGDLLYRWGNPAAYRAGGARDRKLFQQHDAQWIPEGYPGEGHILIFNNGLDRGHSTIEEIVPPLDSRGRYSLGPGSSYGPDKPVWTYRAKSPEDFYSAEISGAHRLPNGNTLICAGVKGTFFEVTPEGRTVWEYVDPVVRGGILAQGEKAGRDSRGHRWNAVFKIHRYAPDYPGLVGRDSRGHRWNAVFKIHRYAPDYPGLVGRDLTPGDVIEQPASMRGETGLDQLDAPREQRRGQGGQRRRGAGRDQPPRRRPGPDARRDGRAESGSPRLPWLLVHADELDADHDGTVARQELLDQAEQVFAAYDRNQDGKLTAEEHGGRGGGGPRLPMAGFVKVHARELDSNGDGDITRQEMADTAGRLFDKSDKNRDGRLTPDEQRAPGDGAATGARTPRT